MADVYLQVIPVHPDQRAALLEQFKKYDVQSQIVGLRDGLIAYPNDPWLQEGLAACYMGLGKPRDAITILEQRLKTGPSRGLFPGQPLAWHSLPTAMLASRCERATGARDG